MSDLPQRDARVVWHPYTQHGIESEPLPVSRAQGAWLELADGRRLLDGISSWWATLHGHSHPALVAAISEQAARLDHVLFAGATHEPAVQLAEELLQVVPDGLSRVFYSDDGSTAVEPEYQLGKLNAALAVLPCETLLGVGAMMSVAVLSIESTSMWTIVA